MIRRLVWAAVLAATARHGYALAVRGGLTLDLGIGRTVRPLGPLTIRIAAPRDIVFDVISAPYLARTPHALGQKLRVLERGEDMVLAAHFTPVRKRIATTVETVRFEPPSRAHFRLVRGPVPYVVEEFALEETPDGTELGYRGDLGADLWVLGRWWGGCVASRWEAAVRESLRSIVAEAERRAQRP